MTPSFTSSPDAPEAGTVVLYPRDTVLVNKSALRGAWAEDAL